MNVDPSQKERPQPASPQQHSPGGAVSQDGLHWVMIWASQMRNGGLPVVCVRTGRQTDNWVPVTFVTGSVRATGELPWDARAAHRARLLRVWGRAGVIAGIAALVVFIVLAATTYLEGAALPVERVIALVGPLIFVIGLALWIIGGSQRVWGIVWLQEGVPDDPLVVLRRVHPDFAKAVRAQQRSTGLAPTPSLVGAGQPRRLITGYESGFVLVESEDLILIEGGRETRAPLTQVAFTHSSSGWTAKSTDAVRFVRMIREPDNEPGLLELIGEIGSAVAQALVEGRRVQREFGPIEVIFEDGYLTMAKLAGRGQLTRVPTHLVDGAGTRTRQVQTKVDKKTGRVTYGTESVMTLYGAGTPLGEAEFSGLTESASRTYADGAVAWVNVVVRALREHQEAVVRDAHEHHVPLVRCLYCGTRVQDVGHCNHCGAPLPQP